MRDRKLDVAQLNGSGHRTAAVTCESPAAGMRDFGDETVSVTAVENASDLGALTARIGNVFQMDGVGTFFADVGSPKQNRPSSLEEGRKRNSQSVAIRSSGARTLEWCARCSLCPRWCRGLRLRGKACRDWGGSERSLHRSESGPTWIR